MERRHSIARDAQILRAFGGSGKVQETEHPTVIAKRLGLRRVPQSDVEIDACADVVRKMLPSPAMTMIKFKASMCRLKRCTVAAQRAVRAHLARRNAALACVFHGLFRTPRLGQAVCSEVVMALAQKLFTSWWTRGWMVMRREMPRARSVAATTAKRNAALYRRRRRQKLDAQSWGPDPKSCQHGAWRFASEVLRQTATSLREQLHAESEAARALDSRAAVALMLRDELPPPVPRTAAPAVAAAAAADPLWMARSAEEFKRSGVLAEVRTRDETGCVWQCHAVPWTNAFGAFDVARRFRGLEVDRMVAQLVATCGEDPSAIPLRLGDGSPVDAKTDAVDVDQLTASTLSTSLARATSPLSPTRRGGDASHGKRMAVQRAMEREEHRREQMRRSLFGQRKTQRAAVLEEFIASEEAVAAAKEHGGETSAIAGTGPPAGSPLAQSRKSAVTEAPDDPDEWLALELATARRAVVERELLEREVVPRPSSALAQRHLRASSLAAYYARMPEAAAEDVTPQHPGAARGPAQLRAVPARQQVQVTPGSGQRPSRPWSAFQERRGLTPAVGSHANRDGRSRSRSPGGQDQHGEVSAEQLAAQHANIEARKAHAWERLALAKRNCAVSFDSRVGALAIPDVIRAAAEGKRGRSPLQAGLPTKASAASRAPGQTNTETWPSQPTRANVDSYATTTQALFDRKRLLVPGKGAAAKSDVLKMPLAESLAASALHQRLDGIREAREKLSAATLGFSVTPASAARRRKL